MSERSSSAEDSTGRPIDREARLLAVLPVVPAITLVVAVALHPPDTADAVATLARIGGPDRGRWILVHLLEPASWLLLGVVGLVATRITAERGRALIKLGGFLVALGAASIALIVYSHGEAYVFMASPGMDIAAMESLYGRFYDGMPLVGPLGLAFWLGMLVLGAGLYRSRAVPRWAALLLALTPVANFAGQSLPAVLIGLPLVGGLAGSGRAIATALPIET